MISSCSAFYFAVLLSVLGGSVASSQTNTIDPAIKRKLTVIQMIWIDLEHEKIGSEARKKLLNEFMEKSAEFVLTVPKTNQSVAGVWILRTLAACELKREREAREGGQAMLALGLDKSDSPLAVKALAFLRRRGWLEEDKRKTAP